MDYKFMDNALWVKSDTTASLEIGINADNDAPTVDVTALKIKYKVDGDNAVSIDNHWFYHYYHPCTLLLGILWHCVFHYYYCKYTFPQKQLPHEMESRLVMIVCAGYIFCKLFL